MIDDMMIVMVTTNDERTCEQLTNDDVEID